MAQVSAGILLYQIRNGSIEVFIVHPGGPYFQDKEEGAWSIPKGLPEENEPLFKAAYREFEEETGITLNDGHPIPLGTIKQKEGKTVHAWAVENDFPTPLQIKSNSFEMEWPPHSGKQQTFPEVDQAGFFSMKTAKKKINPAQVALIDRLKEHIKQHERHS